MNDERTFRTVGVVGAGTMGSGIAIVAARAGLRTLLFDVDAAALRAAREKTERFLRQSVALGKLTEERCALALQCLVPCTRLEELAACELVIEAVFESRATKLALFKQLDAVCPRETILATNTSTLSITEIAGGSGRAERVIGLHFCLPAERMKLVEVTPALGSSEATLRAAIAFCETIGQRPVITDDRPGFILNALAIPFNNSAIRLVEAGVARPASIDIALKQAFGHAMGPLELLDLVGLDTQVLLSEALHANTGETRAFCPPLLRRMVAAGRLGAKQGGGFHAHFPETLPEPMPLAVEVLDAPGAADSESVAAALRSERGGPVLFVSRRVPSHGPPHSLGANAGPDRLLIIKELGAECLGVHTGVDLQATGAPVIGFARYSAGNSSPSRVVELVVPADTPPDALAAALGVVAALGLTAVVCRDRPGRILDRLIRPYLNDALRSVDDGLANAVDIDFTVRTGLGYHEGPIALVERAGLEHHCHVSRMLHEALAEPAFAPARRARIASEHRVQSGTQF